MHILLKVDTAVVVPVNVLPLIDDTDFKTIDSTIAYDESGMSLRWNFVTTAGAVSHTPVTPTTAGIHDWNAKGQGMYTLEIPASGGTINNDTEGYGYFTGVCDAVLPWRGPTITFAPAHVVDGLVSGTDNLQTDAVEISGDSDTADNLQVILTGVGGTGLTLDSIVVSGSAVGGVIDIDNDSGPGITIVGTNFGIASTATASGVDAAGFRGVALGTGGSGASFEGDLTGVSSDIIGDITGTVSGNSTHDAASIFLVDIDQVEATAPTDSLCCMVLLATHSNTRDNANKITVYRTDDTTEFAQLDYTTDQNADPIDGVS